MQDEDDGEPPGPGSVRRSGRQGVAATNAKLAQLKGRTGSDSGSSEGYSNRGVSASSSEESGSELADSEEEEVEQRPAGNKKKRAIVKRRAGGQQASSRKHAVRALEAKDMESDDEDLQQALVASLMDVRGNSRAPPSAVAGDGERRASPQKAQYAEVQRHACISMATGKGH